MSNYVNVRESGRIVSVTVIVAVGVNSDGCGEVLGMMIGPSEAEAFWTDFLRKLARRGLRGVKLVISDAHEGTCQRCRVGSLKKRPVSGPLARAEEPPKFIVIS